MFTLYSADIIGNPGNCSYPNKTEVTGEDSLRAAVCHDYVCAEYKNSYRSGDNFRRDCLPSTVTSTLEDLPIGVLPLALPAAFPVVACSPLQPLQHAREKWKALGRRSLFFSPITA
jgi:hypothetical protein